MKAVIFLLGLLAAFADADGTLKVRYDGRPLDDLIGIDYFIDLPTTVADAVAAAWVLTDRPEGPMPSLFMYCYPDRVVCVLFDDTDHIAGLQIALPVEQWADNIYDMEVNGFTLWTPAGSQTYWTLQQYYVNEEILSLPKEDRLASRKPGQVIQHGGLWVTGLNKELMKISDKSAVVETTFTKQYCIAMMGFHDYYNMSRSTSCADPLFPWFPMTEGPDLVAIGFSVTGRLNKPDLARSWFETPNDVATRVVVYDGPECLHQQARSPGLLTMHIYFVDDPTLITCP